jgi:hypothetical protein
VKEIYNTKTLERVEVKRERVVRQVALALGWVVEGGIVLADLGYLGREITHLLADEADLLLITPADASEHRALVSTLRERIETLFSQLWTRFIDRVFSCSWHGL